MPPARPLPTARIAAHAPRLITRVYTRARTDLAAKTEKGRTVNRDLWGDDDIFVAIDVYPIDNPKKRILSAPPLPRPPKLPLHRLPLTLGAPPHANARRACALACAAPHAAHVFCMSLHAFCVRVTPAGAGQAGHRQGQVQGWRASEALGPPRVESPQRLRLTVRPFALVCARKRGREGGREGGGEEERERGREALLGNNVNNGVNSPPRAALRWVLCQRERERERERERLH